MLVTQQQYSGISQIAEQLKDVLCSFVPRRPPAATAAPATSMSPSSITNSGADVGVVHLSAETVKCGTMRADGGLDPVTAESTCAAAAHHRLQSILSGLGRFADRCWQRLRTFRWR